MYFSSAIVIIFSILFFTEFDPTFGDVKDVDEKMARLVSIGDESRPYPATEAAVNKEFCAHYKDHNDDFLNYIDQTFPLDFDLQIFARIFASEYMKHMRKWCKNHKSRASLAKILRDLNSHVKELKVIRDNHINAMSAASQSNSTLDLKHILCFNDKFVAQVTNEIKNPQTKDYVSKALSGINYLMNNYLKSHVENVKVVNACDYSTIPKQEPKFHSLQLSNIEAVARVINKSKGKLTPVAEDKSEKAVDDSLARFMRIGDETRLYPTTEEGINKEFCSNYEDRNVAFIELIDEKFPNDYEIQIIARIFKTDKLKLLNKFCNNTQSKTSFIKLASDMNNHVKQMKVIRDNQMNMFTEAAKPNTTLDIAHYLCFWDKFIHESSDAITAPESKAYLKKGLQELCDLTKNYIKKFNKKAKAATVCDYSTIPKQEVKLQSVQLLALYAAHNLIKNSNRKN